MAIGRTLRNESNFGMDLNIFASTVDLDITGSIHLWGEPFIPEEWVGVTITLYDAEQVPCLHVSDFPMVYQY